MRFLRLGVVALVTVLCAEPHARAELVVMTDGRFLKARSVEVRDGRVLVTLSSGGALDLSLMRVDRVLEDELMEEPVGPLAAAGLTLTFEEEQQVPETPYGDLIYRNAELHRLNPSVVAAIVRAESNFDPLAESHKGARGLMQLMPATGLDLGRTPEELLDPELNLEAGTRYLSGLVERYDHDLGLVLAAYNAGEGTVARYDGIPPYRETREYIRRIYSFLGLESPSSGTAAGR